MAPLFNNSIIIEMKNKNKPQFISFSSVRDFPELLTFIKAIQGIEASYNDLFFRITTQQLRYGDTDFSVTTKSCASFLVAEVGKRVFVILVS